MSFGGFGSTSAFGSNTTQSAAGTLFGGAATASSQPSNTGGLFGSTTNNNSPAGTLFGTNNTANSSTAGTLFGGSATATSAPGTTGFGGFGSTQTSNIGTTTFGATSTSTASPFGNINTTSQPASSSAFTFNTSAPTSTTNTGGFGGFGTTTNNTANTNTTGGFGGFGTSTNTNSGFGGGFGSNTISSTANKPGLFGSSSTGLFGSQNNTNTFNLQQQQQQQQQPGVPQQKENVWQEFALIRARFDPTSPLCQFRHYFYNKVPPNEVHLYVRPSNQDEQLWNEACRKNPDPTSLVPVLAVGFDDILKRIETQYKQSEVYRNTLIQIAERVSMLRRKQDLGTKIRLEEHKRRHMDLRQRVLRLLRYSQVLRYKGFPLTAEEEAAMNDLGKMATEDYNPEHLASKLNILWGQIQRIREQQSSQRENEIEVWRTVNEEDTNAIAKLLEDEQKGIKLVTNIIKEDEKELKAIEIELKERIKQKTRR